tara:strand:- start:85 stop:657 length:573 start_codon:yes stop_codon:yes gene_type:complete
MFKKFQALAKGGKYVYETVVPKIAKNLKGKRFQQDDIIKTREKVMKEYGVTNPRTRTNLRTKANQPKINKKISDIYEKSEKKQKNLKELKNLSKGAIATSGAGITAAGVSLYNKKKNKNVGSTNPRRPGKKFGGGITTKKSNIKKIQETFGPGSKNPKKSAAKKKKFPDLTGDGKVTFADILKGRGVKRG